MKLLNSPSLLHIGARRPRLGRLLGAAIAMVSVATVLSGQAPAAAGNDPVSSGSGQLTPAPASAGNGGAGGPEAQAGRSGEVRPTSPSPRRAQEARDEYLAGARLLERGDLALSQKHFEQAVRLDPTVPEYQVAARIALEHRVTALVEEAGKDTMLGQPTEARALLAQAHQLDPENAIVTQHTLLPATARFVPVLQSAAGSPAAGSANTADAYDDPLGPRSTATLAGPIQLAPDASRKSFHIRGDLQTAVRQLFTAYGLHVAFDESVAAASPPQGIRFDLQDATFAEAAPVLLRMGRLFFSPLDAHSVLVATDTAANRTRLEHLYQETIYTPGLTPQQLGEVTNVIRQIFDVRQLSMQNAGGNITLRAPAGTLDALNRTLEDLLSGSAEIMLDLRLFSVDTSRTRNIGPTFPQQFGVYNVASAAQALVSANQDAVNQAVAQGVITLGSSSVNNLVLEAGFLVESGLATSSLLSDTIGFFGKGLFLTGVTENGGAGLTLALSSSDTRALDAVQLRANDHQTATFRAGTRYPITVGVYSSGLSSSQSAALSGATINGVSVSSLLNQYLGSSTASATIPQIQYEDLGVTLEATPRVESSGNISMHLDLKIEALTGASEDNIPVLASRRFASDVTVGDGQTALLLSSLSRTESIAVSGIPGLGELPGFQSIAAGRTNEKDTSELVLLLTPHLVRHRMTANVGPRIPVSVEPDSD